MKYLRWLLLPFSLFYGLVVIVRNWCYDAGAFKSYKFKKPVISIGNLDVGGAGKSPMTEYLICLLKNEYKIATLSRGYGRKTKGFLLAEVFQGVPSVPGVPGVPSVPGVLSVPGVPNVPGVMLSSGGTPGTQTTDHSSPSTRTTNHSSSAPHTTHHPSQATQVGDEPAQFKQKFPDITVAVCEKRVEGINQLMPGHDLIILDDAYQHRAVEPGLSILLFDYNRINEPHLLLPAGNLREPFSGRWRAQIIIITKCPPQLSFDEKTALAQKAKLLPYQSLFFTSITYQQLEDREGVTVAIDIDDDTTVFLLTGIANAGPLVKYLGGLTRHIIHHKYPDHHLFTLKNITKLATEYNNCKSQKKIIVTTEKDAQRLDESWFNVGEKLPVFVMPIRVEFLNGSGPEFDQLIINYVREHRKNHSIH